MKDNKIYLQNLKESLIIEWKKGINRKRRISAGTTFKVSIYFDGKCFREAYCSPWPGATLFAEIDSYGVKNDKRAIPGVVRHFFDEMMESWEAKNNREESL